MKRRELTLGLLAIGIASATRAGARTAASPLPRVVSHQADIQKNYERAAYYVDRILKGAKPSDLPIEQPASYELVLNRKAAMAFGITIPSTVILRADRVIE